MVDGYSAAQVREAEAPFLAAGEPLMQRAAAGLAEEIGRLLDSGVPGRSAGAETESMPDSLAAETVVSVAPVAGSAPQVLLLVGTGNNGGDALFAGEALAAEGISVVIVPTGGRMHEEGLAAALAAGARIEAPGDPVDAEAMRGLAATSDLVVDGILGTGSGARPALRGTARDVVAAVLPVVVAPEGPTVVAVDLPSGIDPDDGSVADPLVLPADVTVTFGALKAGLLLAPASGVAGEVRLVDIGLLEELSTVTPLVSIQGSTRS
ncbi:NAD(P)H-hydrate epimerase [Marisediminicola senii]|uniref:NAD(P)H-hydrate epimerase n=1 Tax=Marisediminicola senii TaxID=2711233 RepID=UPI0013EC260E|nr:NAD(P)H-hydrate epimerase [Marisediminicola senii]